MTLAIHVLLQKSSQFSQIWNFASPAWELIAPLLGIRLRLRLVYETEARQ